MQNKNNCIICESIDMYYAIVLFEKWYLNKEARHYVDWLERHLDILYELICLFYSFGSLFYH